MRACAGVGEYGELDAGGLDDAHFGLEAVPVAGVAQVIAGDYEAVAVTYVVASEGAVGAEHFCFGLCGDEFVAAQGFEEVGEIIDRADLRHAAF